MPPAADAAPPMPEPDHAPAPRRLVLASASPRRAELLTTLGLRFDVRTADVDESVHDREAPSAYVERVALAKAAAIAAADTDALVVAADTTVVLDGRILGKPADADAACAMLDRLSGRAHEVLTGVAVARGSDVHGIVEVSRVWFRSLGRAEIEDYVATGEPLDKAGSYAIQGLGGAFVERTEGSWDNIVGLPMAVVARLLAERGGLSGRS